MIYQCDNDNVFGSESCQLDRPKTPPWNLPLSLICRSVENEPTMQSPDQLDDPSPMPQMPGTNDPLRMFDLSDRVAVVTGATGVLGSALAIGLARALGQKWGSWVAGVRPQRQLAR